MADVLELRAGIARATIDLEAGARLSSLVVDGMELLVAREGQPHPYGWGSYVMAPFAGRLRHGKFRFEGTDYALPATFGTPPHAIHGTVCDAPFEVAWASADEAMVSCELTDPWPFGGTVMQHFELSGSGLRQRIAVRSGAKAMPVTFGWHPWWLRTLSRGGPCELLTDWSTAQKWARDEEYVCSGELVEPGPHPYDDCFSGMGEISLVWPGALTMRVHHDCPYVVVYEPDHSVLVEPQTGPPDGFNLMPDAPECRLEPGAMVTETVEWSWRVASRSW
jgi:aldose 1-epimerase